VRMVWLAIALMLTVAFSSLLLIYHYQAGYYGGTLRVTTTTSLYNTGLLEKLAEGFRQKYPRVSIQLIAVGSGEALRRAAQGDADVVLSHAPNLEKKYLSDGTLKPGKIFAYNYFIILGPHDDPAGISGMDPVNAMAAIYKACESGRALFVSRADNSGTNARELILWSLAGVDPSGRPWYVEAGADMAQTLMVANEKKAYTLSDVGTYLKFRKRLDALEPLVEKGEVLINVYSIYTVNPEKVPGVNEKLADAFTEFVLSEDGQKIIESYGVEELGEPLFRAANGDPAGELKSAWEAMARIG